MNAHAKPPAGVVYHHDLIQGTQEWIDARKGILTASEMCRIVTPGTLKAASNDKERALVFELAAQRISKHVEPSYVSDKMLRGEEDEIDMRDLYSARYAPVEQVGFVTNDKFGFTIGYSPDGLVGPKGLIEGKSRDQRFQIETIYKDGIPIEHIVQVQTGLVVADDRDWLDFISYSSGLPMAVYRAEPVPEIQDAILEAARACEAKIAAVVEAYHANVKKHGFGPTERRIERDILL